jgi:hypothetical protein
MFASRISHRLHFANLRKRFNDVISPHYFFTGVPALCVTELSLTSEINLDPMHRAPCTDHSQSDKFVSDEMLIQGETSRSILICGRGDSYFSKNTVSNLSASNLA